MFSVADSGEPANLGSFTNGQHDGSQTTEDTVWTFMCNDGYSLSGSATITCGSTGNWDATVPSCGEYSIEFFLK